MSSSTAFAPPPRAPSSRPSSAQVPYTSSPGSAVTEATWRCRTLLAQLPPVEGHAKYVRAWSIEEALEQHQGLTRQLELQSSIAQNRARVLTMQAEFLQLEALNASQRARQALLDVQGSATDAAGAAGGGSGGNHASEECKLAAVAAADLARGLRVVLHFLGVEEHCAAEKTRIMEKEIEKSNREMVVLRESIDDIARGGGPRVGSEGPSSSAGERRWFYCSDCRVGGHGQRFCSYLLQRPNWRVYPSEKWFEDKNGQVSYCPLGKRGVDFTDETCFSRISMHVKGRIWLEDKRKLYEFVPHLMPLTFVITDCRWVGEPPPHEDPSTPPMPWFVKETDRNWGTSVVCCQRPHECIGLTKPSATYVVQRHIPDPLLYDNGEKCHIKFYNLLFGLEDGVTWHLYTYKDGYLSISPKPWTPTDLSKETQVTIIRTKRINDWPYWQTVYPKCQRAVQEVIRLAAEQGKLQGRNKKQFEIISADFIVNGDLDVYLLEFNTGPVLKDPDDSPDVHDAGMVNGALHIVEPFEGGSEDQWDFVLECKGHPPGPEEFGAL